MSKVNAIFFATPKNGRLIFDNTFDLERYCLENEGIEQVVSLHHSAKLSEKQKLFNYLFGPLMTFAIKAFSDAGYEGMDKTKARYKLQAMFCKSDYLNPQGEVETYLLDLSGMDKFRLLKFVQDIIFHLESEYGQEAPDSQLYKMMKLTGKPFKTTKFKKE